MEFGIFDHVDRGDAPLNRFFEDRLKITEAYDRLGFYCYHVAEHHFTPLGMASSPGIFLSSVAQRTSKLRFGAMVHILPMYHPLRLAEEICMLDQLSEGRVQIGVGRGISPIEAEYFGETTDAVVSRKVFGESLEILLAALTQKRVSVAGHYRHAENVPMELEPMQRPHPPLWMGVNTEENAEQAARLGMNFISLLPPSTMKLRVARYRQILREKPGPTAPDLKAGLSFFIVVGDTDVAAQAIATKAYKIWHKSFHYLYHLHGRSPVFGERASEFAALQAEGRGVAGSPATVLEFLRPHVAQAGINYVVGQFMFGDMTFSQANRSVQLFAEHVMPELRLEYSKAAAA